MKYWSTKWKSLYVKPSASLQSWFFHQMAHFSWRNAPLLNSFNIYTPSPPLQISVFESDKTECAVVLHFLRLVSSISWCIWLFRRPKMQRSFPKFFKFLILCVPVSVSVSFPSLLYFGRGGEESVDCRSEGCLYVIFAFINMNLFPFFYLFSLFPTATTLLMCFIMNTTLRQVFYSSIRGSLVLR